MSPLTAQKTHMEKDYSLRDVVFPKKKQMQQMMMYSHQHDPSFSVPLIRR